MAPLFFRQIIGLVDRVRRVGPLRDRWSRNGAYGAADHAGDCR